MAKIGKTKLLILSAVTLTLYISILCFTTFALFSDSKQVNNHLEAGTLKVGLIQTKVNGNRLSSSGILENFTDNTRIDLTENSNKVFNLENACPGLEQSVSVEVSNLGTTAFTYDVKIIDLKAETENSKALASQLKIKVTNAAGVNEFWLKDFSLQENTVDLGYILADKASQSFSISVIFVNLLGNNDSQKGSVSFDIQVSAVQMTELSKV